MAALSLLSSISTKAAVGAKGMTTVELLSRDARVTVRRRGQPDASGNCVVYWMQRAQRAVDNAALDLAVRIGNELDKPVVVFFAPVPFYPGANQRNLRFLAEGIPDIAEGLARRGVGFWFRSYPEHSLLKFCEKVRPAMVVGDENPLREPESWRQRISDRLRIPFWTVDADVIVAFQAYRKGALRSANYSSTVARTPAEISRAAGECGGSRDLGGASELVVAKLGR